MYIPESFRLHNANLAPGTPKQLPDVIKSTASNLGTTLPTTSASFRDFFQTTVSTAATTLSRVATTLPTTTSTPRKFRGQAFDLFT